MVNSMQPRTVPKTTDTVIVGNGPSALILSYLLHGNVPFYNCSGRSEHPDRHLHRKLTATAGQPLYEALRDINDLTSHFEASGQYSQDAWPVNTLLDTLLWPNLDNGSESSSTIAFERDHDFARDHIILGTAAEAGGQWSEELRTNGDNAKTLSYAEQLSLPGYSLDDFLLETENVVLSCYERPRRPQVSAYLAKYPYKVNIHDSLYNGMRVTSIMRTHNDNYAVVSEDTTGNKSSTICRQVILACGLFSSMIEPPSMLSPYISPLNTALIHHKAPVLIIGSGFSAADAIVENLGKRPVLHFYKWKSAKYISPLKYCHRSSYPEYADIYKRMKISASNMACYTDYQGLADYEITAVKETNGHFEVTLGKDNDNRILVAGEIVFLSGRRTSIDFLQPSTLKSLQLDSTTGWLEKHGLRDQITPIGPALTIDDGRILCIGSITGDSLIKFSYGAVMGACMSVLGYL